MMNHIMESWPLTRLAKLQLHPANDNELNWLTIATRLETWQWTHYF